ncbi:MAG: fumarylacetoacetate hydrolase family protein [Oscillospiraceae bacterium]|nr:fumarylacetoacetate hydrolase family protein [Oscillospiraceae bacterium]
MKLTNILVNETVHLAACTDRGLVDLTAAGFPLSLEQLIVQGDLAAACSTAEDSSLPCVDAPVYTNLVNPGHTILCVGLNYQSHAKAAGFTLPEQPTLFSKFPNALAPCGAGISLPPWEISYDYEAELVMVIGKTAWNVSVEDAMDHVFGFTCGNDLSCRAAQMRSGQWLIGKTMPGFGPCGPEIVTADSFDAFAPHTIRSYVNGELRQDGNISDMIFNCAQIISYASRYVQLEPGDLIFTGTPSGVALEKKDDAHWLKPGDTVDVEIEGIGTLRNFMK